MYDEALALIHDLGHPPFGHAGEDALNECLAEAGGFSHNQHALRILGRAWCHVIWRLWQDRDSYDPARHTALQRVLAATNN